MKASWLEALPDDLLFHCVRDLHRLVALSRASKALSARLGAASACGATLAAPHLDAALAIASESTFCIGELLLTETVSVYDDVELCMDAFMNLSCCDAFESLHTVRVPGHMARALKRAYREKTLAGAWARERWHLPAQSGGFRVIATRAIDASVAKRRA